MGGHYTTGGLLKVITKLQTAIGSMRDLVTNGALDIGDVEATAADIILYAVNSGTSSNI
jgi:hypothetical protein